ncbi:GTP-binding protein [Clostridium sp. 1001275B_160808_H3]|uniref:GTP-binding protein n=1 Tax=Clostridium sp. 1001275B_160808_H3 TaxID=2787110 RepID=UPI00189772A6|nr:GTP-binding protein [Clostridium sp. 1001275B_160808_H3]
MCIKLSELKDNEILLIEDDYNSIMSKEDYLEDLEDYKEYEVYTTTEYKANIDAKDMLDSALECEADNMYEDWYQDIWDDVTEEDIKELQIILDKILSRSKNIAYTAREKVEIDI